MYELRQIDELLWEIPAEAREDMRVPARVFADAELLEAIAEDRSLEQLQGVATLPGVVEAALAMPDIHQGYGFPVGGVAATKPPNGVVSPGGVGYDINCGVRLLALPLAVDELGERKEALVHEISRTVPVGTGGGSGQRMGGARLDRVLAEGPRALQGSDGGARDEDVELTESGGRLEGADPSAVSERARQRGGDQLGTLGSGNHFVEVQRVDAVYEAAAAEAYGLSEGQITILIHSGSRGLGHQVCTDFVRRMDRALGKHGIRLPDRQLSCAPVGSPEGREYLGAMAAAANFAWANRQGIADRVRQAIDRTLGREAARDTRQVYDVAHNVAKLERHNGGELCVHRKGATRAFAAGSPQIPERYRSVGQPTLIPGDMGRASYVAVGTEGAMRETFGSTCHGAGRNLSRHAARRQLRGVDVAGTLAREGIVVRAERRDLLSEEASIAYKDVEAVVRSATDAGHIVPVARLRPLAVIKG
jgi:tRNA-splicing ligase RtcB